MTEPTVRTATPEDAETIQRFIVELATYEREPEAVEVTADVLRAQLASERPPFECLIVELDGAPAGFALFFQSYSTWRGRPGLWLEDLYVRPDARRRGAATAMVRALGRIAVERGYARLELPVLDWNELAHAFYRRLGAEPLWSWTTWRFDGEALAALSRAT